MTGSVSTQHAILVVDDEPRIADLIGAVLKRSGMHPHVVYRGRDALEAVRALPFDVVLLDWVMPDLTGEATAAAIRRRRPELKIIAVSGAGAGLRHQVKVGLIDDFVQKPFSAESLIAAVNRAVAHHHTLARAR